MPRTADWSLQGKENSMPRPSLRRWTQERGQPKHMHPIRAHTVGPRNRNRHRALLCFLLYVPNLHLVCSSQSLDVQTKQKVEHSLSFLAAEPCLSWNYLTSPSRALKFLDKWTPEHQEHVNHCHPLSLSLSPSSTEQKRKETSIPAE